MHVLISFSGVPPAAEDEIKHVEFYGDDESKYKPKHKKLENTLFFEYLKSEWSSYHKRLMTVTFNTTMSEGERVAFCKSVLERRIFCDDMYFDFLGHSESQLRLRTCYLMNASENEIHRHLEKFGAFLETKDLMRAKRIGLLLSPFCYSLDLNENDRIVNKDKGDFLGRHIFTNGCGFMSQQFVSNVRRQLKLPGLEYPKPSAVLVRFQGYEGMLVLKEEQKNDQALREECLDVHGQVLTDERQIDQPLVQFHKSMEKLIISIPEAIGKAKSSIYIVDYSRPHENAYLDEKMIMLLAARGVSVEHLKTLQESYFHLLENIFTEPVYANYFLLQKGRISGGNRRIETELKALRKAEIKEMMPVYVDDPGQESTRRLVGPIRILVSKARVVFGVCDPYNKLEYGECYFQPTLLHQDQQDFEAENQVFVTRSPCYHPGDIRVLKLTQKPGYANLKDCLVLPVKGPRSHAFECAGGDLGGSKFFVCWDAKLIPKKNIKHCSYLPSSSEHLSNFRSYVCSRFKVRRRRKSAKDVKEEMTDYFASFRDDLPNQIDKTYMKLAKGSGLSFKQCEQLSKMFYQATNSTVGRDVLSKKFMEFEQNSMSSAEDSFTEETEESVLLGETRGEESGLELRSPHKRFFRQLLAYICKRPTHKNPPLVNAEVLQEFEERATRFVTKAQEKGYFLGK